MTLSNAPEPNFTESFPLDVPIPPNLAHIAGYPGQAQFVAFWWEPCGDEVYFSDGQMSGTGNSYAFLTWRHHPNVSFHIDQWDIGSSEELGTHALLLDTDDNQMQVALKSDVIPFLRSQHPPPLELTNEQICTIQSNIERLLLEHGQTPISAEEITRRMREQQEAVNEIMAFLDEWGQNSN